MDNAAINGLFGLGLDSVSVPSILANKGLAANSFSMCFGPDGIGRIVFGDKGSSDQQVTPFNIERTKYAFSLCFHFSFFFLFFLSSLIISSIFCAVRVTMSQ